MSDTLILEKPQQVLITQTEKETVLQKNEDGLLVARVTVGEPVVVDSLGNLVHEEELKEHVVQGGVQGPPGIPGASNQFEYVIAGQIVGGNRAVTVNNSGQLVYPDVLSDQSRVYGVTTQSGLQGQLVEVQITGTQTEAGWNWVSNQPVFVGTNGVLTQTVPTVGQVLIVGYAQNPTKLFIDRQPPIYLG